MNTTGSEIIDDLLLAHITNIKVWYPPPKPIFSQNLLIFACFVVFFSMFKCLDFWASVLSLRKCAKSSCIKGQEFDQKGNGRN